jgi:DNA-binding NarL/FixJ family response regulator
VLFVDDDSDVLGGLSKALRKHRARWDMVFVEGGPAGLEEARRATFDVVISDMRMPEIDGASLLLAVREHDPTTFRMILSGFSDQSSVTRALPVAHQFFDKPCDLKALAAALDRACALRAMFVSPPMQALVDRLARLATPDAAIDPDPAASARTLRLAGTIFLRTEPVPVCSPSSAGIALAALVRARIDAPSSAFSMEAHRLHATDVAERAQRAVAVSALAANAFTAGLVHDLGAAVIAIALPEEHAAIEQRSTSAPRQIVEREVLGVTCADLSAYALALWGVPLDIIDAVASQGVETEAPSPLALALRSALAA